MNRKCKILMIAALGGIFTPTTFARTGSWQPGGDTLDVILPESDRMELILPHEPVQWSLDDCIGYARRNNISVLKSALNIEDSQIGLKEAKAALFPSLTASTSQLLDINNETDGDNAVYNSSYSLNAGMTLYNGGRNLKNIQQQKLAIEGSQFNYLATANAVEISIIKAYYQVLYAHESVLTNQEILYASQKQLERSRELFDVGKISKVDLSQIESQYKGDIYQLVLAQTTEAENILNLKQLLQLGENTLFEVLIPSIGEEETLAPVPDKNEVIQIALATLPELKSAATDIRIARLDEEIAKGERLPSISLNASVGTGYTTITESNWGRQMKKGLGEQVGVTVSVPIFNNRQTKSKIEKSRVNILRNELTLQDSQLEISNTISAIHLDAISSQSRFDAALIQVEAARQSYELVSEKYDLGMLNVVDLLVEKNNLLNARQEKIQAKYSSLLDLRLLQFYMTQQ